MECNSRNIYKIGRRTTGFTQEHWAEALGVSVESVRGYETGKQIPCDEVVRAMSEISGLAQLSYWHLCRKSELAAELLPELDAVPLPQAVIRLICSIRDFADRHRSDTLLDIAADGVIDESERPEFDAIVRELEGIVQAALQLKYSEGGAGSGSAFKS